MRPVQGLAALCALLLFASTGALALGVGDPHRPVVLDPRGRPIGDHADSAECVRLRQTIELGKRPADVGEAAVPDFELVHSSEVFVEVTPADLGGQSEIRAPFEQEIISPTAFPQVLVVGRVAGGLPSVVRDLERRARAAGWTPAGTGESTEDDRPIWVLREYRIGGRRVQMQARSCGRAGVLQYLVAPLRASLLPPCIDSPRATADRCRELDELAEAAYGIPREMTVDANGTVRALTGGGSSLLPPGITAFSTIERFQASGWTWTNEAETGCVPLNQLLPGPESNGTGLLRAPDGLPCRGGGAPLTDAEVPEVLRFQRVGTHGRYFAEVRRHDTAASFSGAPLA